MMSFNNPSDRRSFLRRSTYLLLALSVLQTGCGRAVSRFTTNVASSAAGGVVDRVIAQPNSTVELLESELRWMEDNLYRMDDQLETALLELESARRDNATLRRELAAATGDKSQVRRSAIQSAPDLINLSPPVVVEDSYVVPQLAPKLQGPVTVQPAQPPMAVETLPPQAPQPSSVKYDQETTELSPDDPYGLQINYGAPQPVPQDAVTEEPEQVQLEAMPDPNFTPPTAPEELPKSDPFPDDGPAGTPNTESPSVENPNSVMRIRLNPRLTGGYNFDGRTGHEGVMVVIEPQDKYARYTPVSGETVIEVIDPAKDGLAGRVAKWSFDSLDTRRFLKTTTMGKGVHLQLPWPSTPPQNRNLQLSVSYQLANGRTLKTSKRILVDLMPAATWSPDRSNVAEVPSTDGDALRLSERNSNWSPDR